MEKVAPSPPREETQEASEEELELVPEPKEEPPAPPPLAIKSKEEIMQEVVCCWAICLQHFYSPPAFSLGNVYVGLIVGSRVDIALPILGEDADAGSII